MITRFLAVAMLLVSLPLVASAQSGTISGKVTDGDGQPLPGASVSIPSLNLGSTSGSDGMYSIPAVPAGTHTLEGRFLGFITVTRQVSVRAGATATANFTLASDEVLLGAVVVTGTRTGGRTAMQSATPIDKLEAAALERQGNGDMTETLRNLVPSFTATPLTGDGSAFVRPTSLRGLPPDNVLILMNSKRRHRSALIAHFGAAMNVGAHAADVGMVPTIGLKSVEVLRDGAAAQYGSDAIAGVMNFILRDNREGVEVQAQLGQWYEGETDYKISANVGLPLTDRGFLNVSGEYSGSPELSRGVQHAAAQAATDRGIPNVQNPAMNWGRPESSGFRSVWNAGIDLNDTVSLYSFGNFADTYGNYSFFYRAPGRSGALEPLPTNPNNPAQGNFCWCDTFPAGFTPNLEGTQTDFSSVTGLKGSMESGLLYDVSASFGMNRIDYKLLGSLNASWGPDSQFDFHPGDLKQQDTNLNLDLAYPLSDEVNVAGGLEWRQETYTMFEGDEQSWKAGPWAEVFNQIDPQTGSNYAAPGLASNGFAGTGPDIAGEFSGSNWAAYVDTEWDVTEELLIQVALRHEDFSEFGTTNDGKVAARYNASDRLTLRGAVSTGFRAPTPGQANVTTITTSFDGVTGQQVQEGTVRPTHPLAVSLGGKALVPEDAINVSLGFAARSKRLNLTADVYQVEVDNRIIKSRSLSVSGDPNFSELAFYTNALSTKTKGLDIVAVLNGAVNTDFSIAYNYNETEVTGQSLVNGVAPVSDGTIFNIENNLPKHRASATLVHRFGKISAMMRANFYGGTIDERGDREEVGSEALLDLEVTYQVNDQLRVVGGASNLLNNYPDEIGTRLSQGMPYPRRTPIGYHGGMVLLRAVYNF
jgi:iron complex outermembrane receptor protein